MKTHKKCFPVLLQKSILHFFFLTHNFFCITFHQFCLALAWLVYRHWPNHNRQVVSQVCMFKPRHIVLGPVCSKSPSRHSLGKVRPEIPPSKFGDFSSYRVHCFGNNVSNTFALSLSDLNPATWHLCTQMCVSIRRPPPPS